ncbi:MAG: ABC transporter permease [Candidatus Eisenbacteria bacterium]|nr:ABC transporter permease [Candidatus Eisenbacteria bacterium]
MDLWLESAKLALQSLRVNKLRTFLTVLGNLIGVMFVIAILSITQGMTKYVSEKVVDQGSNKFWVQRVGIVRSWDEWVEKNKRKEFTMRELNALRDRGTTFKQVGAARMRNARLKHRNRAVAGINVLGVTDDHPEAEKYPLEAGRHLAAPDVEHRRFVALIGHQVKNELFPGLDPLGRDIRIGPNWFTVIGVAEKQGNVLGEDRDNFVAVPLTAYESQWGTEDNLEFSIQALDATVYEQAQDEATQILRSQRRVPPGKPDDFDLLTAEMFMQIYNNFTSGAYIVMVALAGIALVVGGIVIMNIMLVSVTERTREIGIRKAIGAKRGDILRQFVVEAMILGVMGGLLGVALGVGLSKLVEVLSPLPAVVQPWVIALGLSMATGVGLFFGIWPAMKAAKLDPIAALRHE